MGRTRLRRISDERLIPFIIESAEAGAVVYTDGWTGYSSLATAGYTHQTVVIGCGTKPAHEVLPSVHMAASLLKRWPAGTRQAGAHAQRRRRFLVLFFKKERLACTCFALRSVTPYVTSPPIEAGRSLCG